MTLDDREPHLDPHRADRNGPSSRWRRHQPYASAVSASSSTSFTRRLAAPASSRGRSEAAERVTGDFQRALDEIVVAADEFGDRGVDELRQNCLPSSPRDPRAGAVYAVGGLCRLRRGVLDAERQALLELARAGRIHDEVAQRVRRDLDLEETRLGT
jgi:hypothetical protein